MQLKTFKSNNLIELREEVNSGAEGSIYHTNQGGILAKIHHKYTLEKAEKLIFMINNEPLISAYQEAHIPITWPIDLLVDEANNIVGYLLQNVDSSKSLFDLYHPIKRKKYFPYSSWRTLHIIALQISFILYELHLQEYIIGDFKPENLLVNQSASITFIDVDSFQLLDYTTGKYFVTPVASPEFTAPELFGKDLQSIPRTEEQDCFSLAILIWLLLFGYHPFKIFRSNNDSKYTSTNIDENIKNGHWAFSNTVTGTANLIELPSYKLINDDIKKCFEECFNGGHINPLHRPSALQWVKALINSIESLSSCNQNYLHHYDNQFNTCSWCTRVKQLQEKHNSHSNTIDYFIDGIENYNVNKKNIDVENSIYNSIKDRNSLENHHSIPFFRDKIFFYKKKNTELKNNVEELSVQNSLYIQEITSQRSKIHLHIQKIDVLEKEVKQNNLLILEQQKKFLEINQDLVSKNTLLQKNQEKSTKRKIIARAFIGSGVLSIISFSIFMYPNVQKMQKSNVNLQKEILLIHKFFNQKIENLKSTNKIQKNQIELDKKIIDKFKYENKYLKKTNQEHINEISYLKQKNEATKSISSSNKVSINKSKSLSQYNRDCHADSKLKQTDSIPDEANTYTEKEVSFRKEANRLSKRISIIPAQTPVHTFHNARNGIDENWCNVFYENKRGWIFSGYILPKE